MVDQLHQRGLEVILDVVYNHTGEGGLWRDKINQDVSPDPIGNLANFDPKEVAGLYAFRGLDNAAYYALQGDPAFYVNDTGVGDMTRCNHTPMKQLILDSLHYWAEEMHVDGFRFDLAPVLGEEDLKYGTFDPANSMLQAIADDPVLQAWKVRVIAEPWSLVSSYLGQFPASSALGGVGWYEWNGGFRDWWREFANFDNTTLHTTEYGKDGGAFMTGSYDLFHWNQRRPYHSVNFVTVHDGFTLYDLFSYDHQLNGCGPLNPVCCDSPASAFCDPLSGENNNRSRNWSDESFKRQQIRNLLAAMVIAQGTPMLLGGDEWMRTQLGNNNAYTTSADNPFNWFDWGGWTASPDRVRMHDYARQLLRLRREHSYAFAPADYGSGAPFQWKSESLGTPNFDSKHVAQSYSDASQGPQLFVIINMESGNVTFQLPPGAAWRRLLDTQAFFEGSAEVSGNVTLDAPAAISGSSYGAVGHSIVVLQAAAQ
jgi:glycogen operon protein